MTSEATEAKVLISEATPALRVQILSQITAGLHTPTCRTCLTCRTTRKLEQQALSHNQVQITYATELANSDVNVYMLMKLLGHESMATSQRYVDGAGTENRAAAARNPLYDLLS